MVLLTLFLCQTPLVATQFTIGPLDQEHAVLGSLPPPPPAADKIGYHPFNTQDQSCFKSLRTVLFTEGLGEGGGGISPQGK